MDEVFGTHRVEQPRGGGRLSGACGCLRSETDAVAYRYFYQYFKTLQPFLRFTEFWPHNPILSATGAANSVRATLRLYQQRHGRGSAASREESYWGVMDVHHRQVRVRKCAEGDNRLVNGLACCAASARSWWCADAARVTLKVPPLTVVCPPARSGSAGRTARRAAQWCSSCFGRD